MHLEIHLANVADPTGEGSRPSSPFDISKFDMFSASNISPVTTPPPRTDRVMQYSRHSKENLQRQSTSEIESPLEPAAGDFSSDQSNQLHRHSTPNMHSDVGGVDPPVSPRRAAKLRVVTEHAQAITGVAQSSEVAEVSGFEQDRELEFENMNTDAESCRTESSTSLLREEKRYIPLPPPPSSLSLHSSLPPLHSSLSLPLSLPSSLPSPSILPSILPPPSKNHCTKFHCGLQCYVRVA